MIGFFRKIRRKLADDNKPLKYLRYAIGEVILIVIGILIALQLNNLNEDKADRERERVYLSEYLNDLKICKTDLELKINRTNEHFTHIDNLLTVIQSGKIGLDPSDAGTLLMGSYGWSTFEGSEGTVTEILNSGNLHLIRNPEIRTSIASWHANLKDLQSWEIVLREFVQDYYSVIMDYVDMEVSDRPYHDPMSYLNRDTLYIYYTKTVTRPNLIKLFDHLRFKNLVGDIRWRQKYQNTIYLAKSIEIDTLIAIVNQELLKFD